MNRSEQAAAKRQAELQEALGHLEYFKEMLSAYQQAMKRMQVNLRICDKNVKLWEGRIEKMKRGNA
jgi:hypothetical protein